MSRGSVSVWRLTPRVRRCSSQITIHSFRLYLVTFRLWSSSVLFQEGHRIQISIAGADAGNFERIPAQGETTLELFWGAEGGSYIELPILD